jgi:hypothetical protein
MKIHLAAWALVACTASDTAGNDASVTDALDTDPPTTDTSTDGDTDIEPVEPQSLTGTLIDPAGAPLGGWSVKFCNAVGCRIDTSDPSGVFSYDDVSLTPYSLEPVPPPEGSDWATMNLPYTFDPYEEKVLTFVQQELEGVVPLTVAPMEIELGDGLWVTVGLDDLEEPALHDPATTAGGVLVPQADWPTIDDVTGTVLAVWYTHPFDYVAPDGLPVRIEGNLGLAEGATVDLLVGSYADFAWIDAGALTVTGGELVGEAELPLLSTVIAVQR